MSAYPFQRAEVANAWNNNQYAMEVATITTLSPGNGQFQAATLTLGGGADSLMTPVGGEIWHDDDRLYIGKSDGTWKLVDYAS